MEQSLEFYRDLLGLVVIKNVVRENLPSYDQITGFEDARLHIVALQDEDSSFKLELIQYINPPGITGERDVHHVGASHLGLIVEDIHALYRRLLEAGVAFNCPPLEVVIEGRTEWSLYMFDPDRIPIELIQK
jgi:catechol 2,3-dioxygenase-like lactoylglutathione lyase family enzyme